MFYVFHLVLSVNKFQDYLQYLVVKLVHHLFGFCCKLYLVKLKVEDRDQLALVSLDSRSRAFDSDTELIIKKADFKIKLIQPQNNSFTATIRHKLMWGLDKRS